MNRKQRFNGLRNTTTNDSKHAQDTQPKIYFELFQLTNWKPSSIEVEGRVRC